MDIKKVGLKFNSRPNLRRSTKYVVVHHAQAVECDVLKVHSWHLGRGWCGIGYHFFVRKDGTVYEGRPITWQGAHVSGFNSSSIGICCEGDYTYEDMPSEQMSALVELFEHVKGIYSGLELKFHKEVGSSDCPGDKFPIDSVRDYWESAEETMDQEKESMSKSYTLKFQRFYNQATQTRKPLVQDGVYGPKTEAGLTLLQRIMEGK